MTTLWITGMQRGNRLARLKAVREAMRAFDAEADIQSASDALVALRRQGFAFVGEGDEDAVSAAEGILAGVGVRHKRDLDPDTYAAKLRAKAMTAAGATPEEVFASEAPGAATEVAVESEPLWSTQQAYDTAMVLLAMCDGSPLKAAGEAQLLMRSTGQDDLFADVIRVFCHVFPVTEEILKANGVVSDRV